ncbi:Zn(2)-C6 fungal-type domain-containing protein [Fusarium sp. LHS14.1]|nr:Zn(2)-C6 fungal-type domain-containing protein [Fusarium sp. LHS14.1]
MSDPKACWECHKRRLICNFASPACQKCDARGVACPGYGEKKPLKWLQPGQTRSKGKRAKKEVNVIRLTLKDPSEATSVFEAIEYFNTHICPDLVANGAGGGSNCPFILHPSEAPYIPTAIRHTMVSIALAHRVLQSEQGFEADRALFSTRLQKHRGAAIRHLASDLVQQSFSSSWRQHANTVVELLGGMSTILLCYPFIRPVVRYYILYAQFEYYSPAYLGLIFFSIEILSTTTAPVVEEARARRQMEILGFLPMAFNMGLFTTVPCAPELLVDIVFVNHLQSQAQAYEGAVFDTNLQKASLDLLQRIQSFSVESWVTGIDLNEKLNEDPNKPSKQRQSISWDWQSVAYIYQSAVALYCISSLLYPQYTQDMPQALDEDVDIAAIRSAYLATLLSNIKEIASGSNLQLRKMLIWPLVIAGIEVDVNDEASKKLICGREKDNVDQVGAQQGGIMQSPYCAPIEPLFLDILSKIIEVETMFYQPPKYPS